MALLTQKAIFSTFQEMLEEMPFDKITVSALVKRSGISSNTFYYHYQDIFALLEVWLDNLLEEIIKEIEDETDWVTETKVILKKFQANPNIVNHIFNSLSRDQMERYIYHYNNDLIARHVRLMANGLDVPEETLDEIILFCRFSYLGFCLKFLLDHMVENVDESVDKLSFLFDNFIESSLAEYR